MRQIRITKQSILTVVCLLSAASASASIIFERAACPDSSYTQCANSGLPSDFCCPSTSTCIPLAQNTTLLCCPSGSDCSTIQPITCDISTQNITAHPDNTLKTTVLTATLQKCGKDCCPFGYTCINANCVLNDNQADSVPGVVSSSTLPATSSTAQPISTNPSATASNPSMTPVTSASSSTQTPTSIKSKCNKFPVEAVLVGFFPGIALGLLISLLGLVCLGRLKTSNRKSGSSFGNISDPVPTSDVRTDFLRKMPPTPSTSAGSTPLGRHNTLTRVRSLFRKSNATTGGSTSGFHYKNSPNPNLGHMPPIPLIIQRQATVPEAEERPVTPPLQREPSYEDINIFTDTDTASMLRAREKMNQSQNLEVPHLDDSRAVSHQTTFTDMMERSGLAGLQKGQRTYQHLDQPQNQHPHET